MGWNLRRSKKLGLFRVNLSKSGLGFSVGVRGFRVGRDAHGRAYTATSIPGTGIYRKDYLKKTQAPPPPQPNLPQSAPPRAKAATPRILWYLLGAVLLYLLIKLLS